MPSIVLFPFCLLSATWKLIQHFMPGDIDSICHSAKVNCLMNHILIVYYSCIFNFNIFHFIFYCFVVLCTRLRMSNFMLIKAYYYYYYCTHAVISTTIVVGHTVIGRWVFILLVSIRSHTALRSCSTEKLLSRQLFHTEHSENLMWRDQPSSILYTHHHQLIFVKHLLQ